MKEGLWKRIGRQCRKYLTLIVVASLLAQATASVSASVKNNEQSEAVSAGRNTVAGGSAESNESTASGGSAASNGSTASSGSAESNGSTASGGSAASNENIEAGAAGTVSGDDSGDDGASGGPGRTESIDWTNRTAYLALGLSGAVYRTAEGVEEFSASGNRVDMSGLELTGDGRLALEFTYAFLKGEDGTGENVQAGDGFRLSFVGTLFLCEDTPMPREIKNGAGEVVASWTCAGNIVTVLFGEPSGDEAGMDASFSVEITVDEGALTPEPSEAAFTLQSPEGGDAVRAVAVLPARQDRQDGQASDDALKNFFTGTERPVLFSAAGNLTEGAGRSVVKTIIKNPQEGVSKVLLAVDSPMDGYTKNSVDLSFGFGVDITLDSAYLMRIANEFAGNPDYPAYDLYPSTAEGLKQYQKDVDRFFMNNPEVPAFSYTLDLGKGYLLDKDGTADSLSRFITEAGAYETQKPANEEEIIGYVSLNKVDKGLPTERLRMTLRFSKRIFNRTSIKLGFTETLYVDKNHLTDESQNVGWKEGELKLVPVTGAGGGSDTDNQPFTVDKTGPAATGGAEVSYTIVVAAPAGKKLDGMRLEETLPTANSTVLEVVSLSVDGAAVNAAGGAPAVGVPSGYVIENGILKYTFPEGENRTFAELLVNLRFTSGQRDWLTAEYSRDPAAFSHVLKDQAKLYPKGGGTAPAASSEEVSTALRPGAIQKDGKQDSINGDRFHWTISADTEFIGYSLTGAYLIDYINRNAHTYDTGSNVSVRTEGNALPQELPYVYLGDTAESEWLPANLIDCEAVKRLGQSFGNALADGSAYYYNCGDYSVMIIPYAAEYRNGKTEITYDTRMADSAPAKTEIGNDVSFVWSYRNDAGAGPGSIKAASAKINIDKAGTPAAAEGSKTGVGFDESTKTARWRFQVNYYPSRAALRDVQIRESFENAKQELLSDSLSYTLWDRSTGTKTSGSVGPGAAGSSAYPYYTYDTGTGEFILYLGNIETNQYYDIRMNTKVMDGNALNGGDNKFQNSAVLSVAGPNSSRLETPLAGQVPSHEKWIIKDSAGSFDYAEKAFTWIVTVNPNHLKLKNPVVTDTLPEGNAFGKLTEVKSVAADGTETDGTVDGGGRTATVGGVAVKAEAVAAAPGTAGQEKLTIGDSGFTTTDTFVLTYTTVVGDEPYKKYLEDHAAPAPDKNIQFENKADLSGSYVDPLNAEFPIAASDTAVNCLQANMVEKDGKYFAAEGKITWQADVNTERIDMTGVEVIEDLAAGGMGAFMELVPKSVRLYKLNVGADGTVTRGDEITAGTGVGAAFTKKDKSGFTFQIPAAYKDIPLRFVFDTCFIDSAAPNQIQNKIRLHSNAFDFSSDTSNGNMSGNFDIDDYVTIAVTPVMKLYKKSGNSVIDPANPDKGLDLKGAKFGLSGYVKDDGGSETVYKQDLSIVRTGATKDNGNAVFVNLEPGVLYRIEETEAPAGYVKSADVKYFYFAAYGETAPSADFKLADAGGSPTGTVVSNNEVDIYSQAKAGGIYTKQGGKPPFLVYTNAPEAANEITFQKLGADGAALLNGVEFSLKPADGRIGKTEWERQVSGSSGLGGSVTFPSIDAGSSAEKPLEYTLTETKNPEAAYDQGQTFTVRAWMDGSSFKYSIVRKDGADKQGVTVSEVTGDQSSGYQIKNLHRTGTVKLKKLDAVTGEPLYSPQNNYREAVFVLVDSTDTAPLSELSTAKPDRDGIVAFTKVPYRADGYRIVEKSTQPGYTMPGGGSTVTIGGKSYPVVGTITGAETAQAITAEEPNITDKEKKPGFFIDHTGAGREIKNSRATGKISFTKKNDKGAAGALENRTFLLWHVAENQSGNKDSYYSNAAEAKVINGKKCWLIAQETSDASGEVEFITANRTNAAADLIAWGEYFITENIPENDLYKPIGDTALHVTGEMLLRGIAGPDITAEGAAFAYQASTEGAAAGTVVNVLKTASLTVCKVDRIEVSAGRFEAEKLQGIEFVLTGTDYYGNPVNLTQSTDAGGKLTFADLKVCGQEPGGAYVPYTLTEARPRGYQAPTAYHVYVTPENAAGTAEREARIVVKPVAGATEGAAVWDSASSASVWEIDNEPIKGRLTFHKQMVTGRTELAGLNGKPLAGAGFTLKRVVGGAEYAVKTVASGTDGSIVFDNIEFGVYKLYETACPEGFTDSAPGGTAGSGSGRLVAEVTRQTLLSLPEFDGNNTPDGFVYENTAPFDNKLIVRELKLKKTGADGAPLPDVEFKIYRRGGEAAADGTGLNAAVEAGVHTYGGYGPVKSIRTGADGAVSVTLPYGDYLLIEQPKYDLQDGKNAAALWAGVGRDALTVKKTDKLPPFTPGVTAVNPSDPSGSGWEALTAGTDGRFEVVNYLKYGFINLNKTAGEKKSDGVLEAAGNPRPLAGARFEILKKDGADYTHYLTLTTDAEGRFPVVVASGDVHWGMYRDEAAAADVYRHLTYGEYKIKELEPPAGFEKSAAEVSFTVEESTAGHLGTVWIKSAGSSSEAVCQKAGDAAPPVGGCAYYNELVRGALTLTKKDDGGNPVSGARFAVLNADGRMVASMTESTETGRKGQYLLTEPAEEDLPAGCEKQEANAAGDRYLYKDAEGLWKLLPGSYTIKESAVPFGYLAAADKTVTVNAGDNAAEMTDVYIRGHVTLTKTIKDASAPVEGAVFALYKETGGAPELVGDNLATDAAGKWSSMGSASEKRNEPGKTLGAGLEAGRYYFVETASTQGTALDANTHWEFEVTKDTHYAAVNAPISAAAENEAFTSRARLKKTEDAAHGYAPVQDAQFRLEYKAPGAAVFTQAGAERITDAAGEILFENLAKGRYRITETANTGYDLNSPFTAEFEVTDADHKQEIDLASSRLIPHADSGDAFQEGTGIVNSRLTGSVTLVKADGDDPARELKGAVFALYRKRSTDSLWEKLTEFLTGKQYDLVTGISGGNLASEGSLTIEGLDWGEYKLEEAKAASGYKNEGISIEFAFSRGSGKAITLTVDGHNIYNYQNLLIIRKKAAGSGAALAGAGFTITDRASVQEVYRGEVGDGSVGTEKGALYVKGALEGGHTYVLRETMPPGGYRSAEDIVFTMDDDGTVRIDGRAQKDNAITVRDELTRIEFAKTGKYNESCSDPKLGAPEPGAARALAGAEFTVYTDAACTQEALLNTGARATAVSDDKGRVVIEGLPLGADGSDRVYYIRETSAPAGHQKNNRTYLARLTNGRFAGLETEEGLLKDNTVVNDVLRGSIRFIKKDEKDPARVLPGSTYGLYKESKKRFRLFAAAGVTPPPQSGLQLLATAVTDQNGVLEFDGVLLNTDYTIRELKAPDGSIVSENPIVIAFSADSAGNVVISRFDSGGGTAQMDPVTGEIVWLEPQTEISIAKVDENGKPLAGAALRIVDEDGNTAVSFSSPAGTETMVRGILIAGRTYTLEETAAPRGYQLAEPVTFTVIDEPLGPNTPRVQRVEMIDKKLPPAQDGGGSGDNTGTPENTPGSAAEADKTDKPAKSAGTKDISGYVALLLAALIMCEALLWKGLDRKKR